MSSNRTTRPSPKGRPPLTVVKKATNFDLTEIERTLRRFHPTGHFEIRVLDADFKPGKAIPKLFSADEILKAAQYAADWSGKAKGVYFTLNPVEPKTKGAAGDNEIARLTALGIDCDAVRTSGISSTDAEHDAALKRACEVRLYLMDEFGFPVLDLCDSGNGGHVNCRIDLPNDEPSRKRVEEFLAALARRFPDDVVKVDTTVANPSRIWKTYGTMACKGSDTPDRPHRLAKILKAPEKMELVTWEMLEAVIRANPPPSRKLNKDKNENKSSRHPITWSDVKPVVEDWITKEKEQNKDGLTLYELDRCPFGTEHHKGSTAGFLDVYANGDVVPRCLSDNCKGKNFRDFIRASAPELLEKLERSKLERLKDRFYRAPTYDGDGERLRVSDRQFREIRGAINAEKAWYPATVEWLIKDGVYFENYFAREPSGFLYVWERGCYRDTAEQRIRSLAKLIIPPALWSTKFVNETIALIKADSRPLWMRPPLDVLNLENGLLDLKTRELKPHTPDHLSMVQLPVRYDPNAKCPKWDAQVAATFPHDAVGVAEEIVAWFMTPDTSRQKAILFLGPGGTGKSTWLTWLGNFLGVNNISSVSLQHLEQNRFASYQLIGKLANICADLPSAHLFSTSIFRALTGGDQISVERKFHQPFTYLPFTRLIFSANDPPQSEDATDAFFERWIVLNFTNVFRGKTNERKRKELDAELAAPEEMSGVFNKALARLEHGQAITVSASMRESHDEFRKVTDPMAVWLAKRTINVPEGMIPPQELLDAYNHDAAEDKRALMQKTSFGIAMKRHRPDLKQGKRIYHGKPNTNCYLGIATRN